MLEDDGKALPQRPYDEDGRTYYAVVPEDAQFRALMDLLAAEERAAQIPIVLSWMRFLGVQPQRVTLAAALVYWSEVTLEGPWFERWKGEKSRYIALLKWITQWVGRRHTPHRGDMQDALGRVKWLREVIPPQPQEVKNEDDEDM